MKKCRHVLILMLFAILLVISGATVILSDDSKDAGSNVYDINVITYNVCGLPDFITFDRGLVPTKKRFSYIGKNLKQYDIIGLQEAFIADREIIEKSLKTHYVVHGTDVGTVKMLGSGVYIFSRWPVSRSHFEQWNYTGGPDALSHKGFVAATVHVSKELAVDVYNLHGQTQWTDMKLKNYAQLANFMEYFSLGEGRPILLIGDFNCRLESEVCNYVIDRMNMETAFPEQDHVDHIFFNENYSGWKMSALSAGKSFVEKMGGKRISDHVAVESVIRIEKK